MPSDPFHDKPLYPSSSAWGIPNLPYASPESAPQWLVPYRTRIRDGVTTGGAVHFFLYDAFFESVWNAPRKAGRYLQDYSTLLTPDFSLGQDMPLAAQVWNVYRSRWCGAHWAAQDFTVIPTVSWGGPESYAFCFDGLARHSAVALTTLGVRRQKASFLHGFAALMERVQPGLILCYGDALPDMHRANLRVYPDRWQGLKAARDGR